MSYKKGAEAFISRFKKKFPEFEYLWDVKKSSGNGASIMGGGIFLCRSGPYDSVTYDVYPIGTIPNIKEDKKILSIKIDLIFGIRINITSKYLDKGFHLHRRPKNICKGNIHGMRHWLANKPKFAKLGANISSQIHEKMKTI